MGEIDASKTAGGATSTSPASILEVDLGAVVLADRATPHIRTVSFTSAIAVVVLVRDPRSGSYVAGFATPSLPSSRIAPQLAEERPGLFVDVGLGALVSAFAARGLRLEDLEPICFLVGGGDPPTEHGGGSDSALHLGRRNVLEAQRTLSKAGIPVRDARIGSSTTRVLTVDLAVPRITLQTPSSTEDLL
jgi:chemotaxis receptor (MCP) glutamine deamidase CheD